LCILDVYLRLCAPQTFFYPQARVVLNANGAFPEPWDKVKSEPGIIDLRAEEAAELEEAAANCIKAIEGKNMSSNRG
jgi:hypothetical protein